jgi:hypothetical protein
MSDAPAFFLDEVKGVEYAINGNEARLGLATWSCMLHMHWPHHL